MTQPPPRPPSVRAELTAPRPASETIARWVLGAAGYASVLVTAGIVAVLLVESLAFFRDVPLTLPDYFAQLALHLRWQDFALFVIKTTFCGVIL